MTRLKNFIRRWRVLLGICAAFYVGYAGLGIIMLSDAWYRASKIYIECSLAKGRLNIDYVYGIDGCFYLEMKRFRSLMPQYNDLSDTEVRNVTAAVSHHEPVNLLGETIFCLFAMPLFGGVVFGNYFYWMGVGALWLGKQAIRRVLPGSL